MKRFAVLSLLLMFAVCLFAGETFWVTKRYPRTDALYVYPDAWVEFFIDGADTTGDTARVFADSSDSTGAVIKPGTLETNVYDIYVNEVYYCQDYHIKQKGDTLVAGVLEGVVGGTMDSAIYADTAEHAEYAESAGVAVNAHSADSAVIADSTHHPDSTDIAGMGFGSGGTDSSTVAGWGFVNVPDYTDSTDVDGWSYINVPDYTDSSDVAGWGFGATTDSSDVAGWNYINSPDYTDSTDVAGFGFIAGAHTDSSGVAGFGFVAGAHTDSGDVAGWNYVNALDYTDSTDVNGWNYFNTEAELTGLLDDNYAQLHGVASDTVYHALWADSADFATAAGGVADTAAWADSAGYADSAGVAGKALDLDATSSVVEDSEVDNDITIAGANNVIGLVASLGAKEDTGHVHSGSEITSGTVPDSVCPDTLHRDYETKDGDYVSFDDPDNNFIAINIDEAMSELFDNIGGVGHIPNQATSKIDWSELNAVPAGFADGVDNTGSAEWVDDGDYIYPTENDSVRIITGTDTTWITGLGIDLWTGSGGKSDTGHTHDGRYYTETEVDGFVGAKTDTLDFAKVADDTTNFKTAYGWGDHSTQGYIDTASLNSEAELEGILVGVTNVFTNNDGALNDDDVSLADVQTATTSDFHNIGGTDANSIDSIFFQLTNGTWGTQGWYGLNDTFDVDTSDATGGAAGDSSWVACSITVAYVDIFRPRSTSDSIWFFGTCIFEAGSTKVGSIWVYNRFSGASRLIPDSVLNFFGYPNSEKDSSMARWVNVFDEFANSNQSNLQDVLDDFDEAITNAGFAGFGWGVETFGSPESLRADMTTLNDTFYTKTQIHDTLSHYNDTSYVANDAHAADNLTIDASGSVSHDAVDSYVCIRDEATILSGDFLNIAHPWADSELVSTMATEAEAQASAQDTASVYANTVRSEIGDSAVLHCGGDTIGGAAHIQGVVWFKDGTNIEATRNNDTLSFSAGAALATDTESQGHAQDSASTYADAVRSEIDDSAKLYCYDPADAAFVDSTKIVNSGIAWADFSANAQAQAQQDSTEVAAYGFVAGALNADDLSDDPLDALQNVEAISEAQGNILWYDTVGTDAWGILTTGSQYQALKIGADGAVTWGTDDDVPESGDFGAAGALEADGSLSINVIDSTKVVANALSLSGDLHAFTSAHLLGRLSDETGSGLAVFATAPTFTTSITIGAAGINETELEILDGASLTTTELNYVDGVTSAIQTQLDNIAFPFAASFVFYDTVATSDSVPAIVIPATYDSVNIDSLMIYCLDPDGDAADSIQIKTYKGSADMFSATDPPILSGSTKYDAAQPDTTHLVGGNIIRCRAIKTDGDWVTVTVTLYGKCWF